ncbi:hypothetical protein JX265_011723 [Neoarthrinium moseri]|uniref:Uncharacterized protein n=1 Tax=Neoarthrinium moseri TaxID=1658444 RepID=A0A9P9WBR8_9PEZI|nr:uncharacterized protein JN550_002026 [Neoarthrinium moseri]KAI1856211.1 hypothetical protein JX265_011723 [Neoarthrinium moseri]KAI1875740.1 hypothetical protein JN550_002026 [Neoarthrinium moseri]
MDDIRLSYQEDFVAYVMMRLSRPLALRQCQLGLDRFSAAGIGPLSARTPCPTNPKPPSRRRSFNAPTTIESFDVQSINQAQTAANNSNPTAPESLNLAESDLSGVRSALGHSALRFVSTLKLRASSPAPATGDVSHDAVLLLLLQAPASRTTLLAYSGGVLSRARRHPGLFFALRPKPQAWGSLGPVARPNGELTTLARSLQVLASPLASPTS